MWGQAFVFLPSLYLHLTRLTHEGSAESVGG
jgi:hypothetical protein